jgi:hypothetical protein
LSPEGTTELCIYGWLNFSISPNDAANHLINTQLQLGASRPSFTPSPSRSGGEGRGEEALLLNKLPTRTHSSHHSSNLA